MQFGATHFFASDLNPNYIWIVLDALHLLERVRSQGFRVEAFFANT